MDSDEAMMQFYVLKVEVGSTYETWFEKTEPIHRGDALYCPTCGINVTNLRWLPPYRAAIKAYGRELGDVAFFGMSILVSHRFRLAWEQAGLRGINEFTPLERVRVRPARLGKRPVNYYHVEVRQFGTRVDMKRSLIEYGEPITCDRCLSAGVDTVRGFAIDERSWTGEDIFEAWGMPGSIIVTDRVRQLRDEHGLTNVNLTPVEEYFWDPLSKWTPVDYSPPDWYKPDETDDGDDAQRLAN
ncbi:MAG: hypothetical protein IPM54_12810 [Polyangiaceae bacterium]|nr:hypothetical protein [Polyangiaceae bacterium]